METTLINVVSRFAFYKIRRDGTDVIIRFGRMGTRGQTQVKSFADVRSAQFFLESKVEAKTMEGDYVLVAA